MSGLSAVIITLNEEENIARTLNALKTAVDEIVVVDAFSEDKTVEICKKMNVKVVKKKWEGYTINKNYGNFLCKNDWILSIDADEVLSDELAHSIRNLEMVEGNVYAFNLLSNYCGTWVKHSGWHPDWKTRIFNRKEVCWQGEFVHETLNIPANFKTVRIDGLVLHYSYKDRKHHLQKIERYAKLAAEELFKRGKKSNLFLLWGRPIVMFLRFFILNKGFLDGKTGWLISYGEGVGIHRTYQILKELNRNVIE